MADNPFLQFGPVAPNRSTKPVNTPFGILRDPNAGKGKQTYNPANDPIRANADRAFRQMGYPNQSDIVQSGAPAKVRAAVASVQKNSDQIAALKKYYKDVLPYGTDNFIFRDPKNGNKWTIFNPSGFDVGDLAANGRIAANVAGGIVGGALGVLGGPAAPATVPAGSASGATAGGVLYDKAVQKITGAKDTRTTGQQLADAAIETGLNLVIPEVGGKVVKGVRNLLRTGDQAAVDAAARQGIRAPVAVTGSRGAQITAGALDATVTSSGKMASRNERFVGDMGQRLRDVTSGSAATKAEAGNIIKNSADDYVRNFRAESSRLYDEVDKLIAPDSRVAFDNFVQKIDDINGRYSGDPEFRDLLTDPMVKKLIDATDASINRGGVTYQTLKDLRTMLGQQINSGKGKIIDFFGTADTNAMYGALTDDMALAARQVGGAPAEDAANIASQYWKNGRRVIDTRIEPVVGVGKANTAPEKVYDAFMETAKTSPSALDDWKAVVPASQRETLGKFTAGRLGNSTAATEGALVDGAADTTFSPNAFVRNFNNTFNGADRGPARDFFFPNQGVLSDVGDIFTLSNGAKAAGLQNNSSRTAAVTGTTSLLGGTATAVPLILSGAASATDVALTGGAGALAWPVMANPLARAMTSQTGERLMSRPALNSALPEITDRLSPELRRLLNTQVGEVAQAPFRQEQNADTGYADTNPFLIFGDQQP